MGTISACEKGSQWERTLDLMQEMRRCMLQSHPAPSHSGHMPGDGRRKDHRHSHANMAPMPNMQGMPPVQSMPNMQYDPTFFLPKNEDMQDGGGVEWPQDMV